MDLGSTLRDQPAAPRLANTILFTVLTGFGVVAVLNEAYQVRSMPRLLVVAVLIAAIVAVQLGYFARLSRTRSTRLTWAMLVLQAGLTIGPLFAFSQSWIGQPGFFGGSLLIALPLRVGIPAFVTVVVGVGVAQNAMTGSILDTTYATVSTVMTGLVIYGLTTLARAIADLHEARTALAALAISAERDRFARDLHDLLGHTLSAVTLKSELSRKLLSDNPERAATELAELTDIARQALGDVRRVASGYADRSLRSEVEAASSLLRAAGIEVTSSVDYESLPPDVEYAATAVVREAVTNILRHSTARTCDIRVTIAGGRLAVRVANDGAAAPGADATAASGTAMEIDRRTPTTAGGHGLANLKARVGALGGTATASRQSDLFLFEIDVPIR